MEDNKKENKNAVVLKINKDKLRKILFTFIILGLLVLTIFVIKNEIKSSYDKGYKEGFNEGLNSIISSQTATGEFYIFNNGSITNVSIAENCKVVEE